MWSCEGFHTILYVSEKSARLLQIRQFLDLTPGLCSGSCSHPDQSLASTSCLSVMQLVTEAKIQPIYISWPNTCRDMCTFYSSSFSHNLSSQSCLVAWIHMNDTGGRLVHGTVSRKGVSFQESAEKWISFRAGVCGWRGGVICLNPNVEHVTSLCLGTEFPSCAHAYGGEACFT